MGRVQQSNGLLLVIVNRGILLQLLLLHILGKNGAVLRVTVGISLESYTHTFLGIACLSSAKLYLNAW